jgi:hypothetical protein
MALCITRSLPLGDVGEQAADEAFLDDIGLRDVLEQGVVRLLETCPRPASLLEALRVFSAQLEAADGGESKDDTAAETTLSVFVETLAGDQPVPLHNINPATTTVLHMVHQAQALASIPLDKQVVTITIASSEAELPDLAAMTPEERAAEHDKQRGLVPAAMHDAKNAFTVKTREIWNPLTLKLGDVTKYCDGHPSMWTEDRLKEEVRKAGDWAMKDPISSILGNGENAFDITVGNEDSFAVVGFDKSEFGDFKPPIPEGTVKAFASVVQISVAKVNDVVSPAFRHLVRLLKMEAVIKVVDKYEAKKAARANRLRRGKDGGYGATEEERKESEDADAIDDANNVDDDDGDDAGLVHLGLSVVDRVMGERGGFRRPTNLHTRVANFMLATGTNPDTRVRVSKNHELTVRTSAEFLNRVISNGEIIIRDHFKPLCDRVFPPADMGGIAGVSTHEHLFTQPAAPRAPPPQHI